MATPDRRAIVDRLKQQLEEKLEECGWVDEMRTYAKGMAFGEIWKYYMTRKVRLWKVLLCDYNVPLSSGKY